MYIYEANIRENPNFGFLIEESKFRIFPDICCTKCMEPWTTYTPGHDTLEYSVFKCTLKGLKLKRETVWSLFDI